MYTWYDSDPASKGGNAGIPSEGTDTEDFIAAVDSEGGYGGHTDWRIPTRIELVTIVNRNRDNQSIDIAIITFLANNINLLLFANRASPWQISGFITQGTPLDQARESSL